MKMMKLFSISILLMMTLVANAAEPVFRAGTDYRVLAKPVVIDKALPGKIRVLEFFSYGCPYCYRFDPIMHAWLATHPKDVEFERVPVIFHPDWQLYAQAFYTAKNLGVLERAHSDLFTLIQQKPNTLANKGNFAMFFKHYGIEPDAFISAWEFSPAIANELGRAAQLSEMYGIYEIPTLAVGGKYVVNPNTTNGDDQRLLHVLDYLIAKVRVEQSQK